MSKDLILEIDKLSKKYETVEAVNGVSFEIKAGEIIGLLGPNGAGKTTMINMILGILEPTSGSVVMLGKNMQKARPEVAGAINFAAVYAHMPPNLTVWQSLYIFGLLYEVKNLNEKINSLIKEFDLENFRDTRAGLLSSGEMSRLNLAKAVINEPCLLLLDEPTASLDPSVAQIVRERIKNYAATSGAAVLWTSHNMKEIEEVCEKVMFISHGKILLTGDPKKLPEQYNQKDLEELFIKIAREPLTFEK